MKLGSLEEEQVWWGEVQCIMFPSSLRCLLDIPVKQDRFRIKEV